MRQEFLAVRLIVFLLFFSGLCFAQKPAYDFTAAEMKSRQLVYSNPPEALKLIKATLSQKGKLHDTIYGNTYTLYGLYYNMAGKPDSALYYYQKALPFHKQFPRNKVRTIFNISGAYRNKGDYKTSIKYANDALSLNKKIKNIVGVAIAYGELASNYNYLLDYKKSVDYLLKAIAILKKEKNTKQLPAVKQYLANTYLRMENYKFAIDLYKECLVDFKAVKSEKNYYLTLVNMAEAQTQTDDFNRAKASLKEAVTGLEQYGDVELVGITYSKIATIEELEGQELAAVKSFKNAISRLAQVNSSRIVRVSADYVRLLNRQKNYTEALNILALAEAGGKVNEANIEDRVQFFKACAETYTLTNRGTKAIMAYKATTELMDSIARTENETAIHEIQAKFQTELQREKNIVLESKNKNLEQAMRTEKIIMVLYVIISIALLIMILALLRGYRLKNKLQKTELASVEAERNLIQQQRQHDQELNAAQQQIIEEKQRELTSVALRMANYQDNLNEVIEKCDNNVLVKANDVKKELQQLIKRKDYWKQFETRFNKLHPDFNTNLAQRFSKLTKNDIEFCSLLKLNLSNKEIASLLQISHESAITKKYRIKKKMEINDDNEFEKILLEI